MYRRKWLILVCLPLFFLTGCWDQKDPEDRTFLISMGIDQAAEGCRFSFAPANMEQGEGEVLQAENRTLAGAVAHIDTRTSRRTDLGQLKTIVCSREILEEKEQLEGLLLELERSQAVSGKVMLLATTDSAADCMEAILAEDGKTGLFLWDFYKNTAREVAVTKGVDLNTFLTERMEQNGKSILPLIAVKDGKLELGGGMAVTEDRVYPLSDREMRGYLFLTGDAEGALLEEAYRGEVLPLAIGKSDVIYTFSPQGEGILCRIQLPLEGTLQGGSGPFLLEQEQEKLERLFADSIKQEIGHTLEVAGDLVGILPRLYQEAPELAEGRSQEELWQAMTISLEPELKLKDMGRKR